MLKLNIKTCIILLFFMLTSIIYANIVSANNTLLTATEYKEIQNEILGLIKATEAHPSNIYIHMRLGHLYHKMGELEKALEQFIEVTRLKPRYYKAALEAGYLYRRMGKDNLAEQEFKRAAKYGDSESKEKAGLELEDIVKTKYRNKLQELIDTTYEFYYNGEMNQASSHFEKLIKMEPDNALFRVDLSFVYISLGKHEEAIKELELLKDQDQLSYDGRIALGFAYDKTNRTALAIKEYNIVASGKNPTSAAEAKKRLASIAKRTTSVSALPKIEPPLPVVIDKLSTEPQASLPIAVPSTVQSPSLELIDKVTDESPGPISKNSKEEVSKKKPFPIQLYSISFTGTYYERFGNTVFDITTRQRLFPEKLSKSLHIYLEENFIRDTKSKGGEFPDIYSDNVLQIGLGARLKPIETEYLYLYGIGYAGYKLIKEDGNYQAYGDFRSGINYYKGWGTHYLPKNLSKPILFVMKEWGEIGFDISYYNRFDNNVIGYVNIKEGEKILRVKNRDLDGYLRNNTIMDSRGEFYNNLTEVGMGLRLQIIPQKSFYVSCERMWGFYFGREATDPNPYGNQYNDLRIQITFYHEW